MKCYGIENAKKKMKRSECRKTYKPDTILAFIFAAYHFYDDRFLTK